MPALVENGYKIFTDVDGDPLEDGYIYIGEAGLNPLSNPLQPYWDSTLSTPASNIRTKGGYPSNGGTPGRLYTATGSYSILVRDKKGATVYQLLDSVDYFNSPSGDTSSQTDTIATLKTIIPLTDGYTMKVRGYYAIGDVNDIPTYYWDQSSSSVDDGGAVIIPDGYVQGVDAGRWVWSNPKEVKTEWFGTKGSADQVSFQAAVDYMIANTIKIIGGSVTFTGTATLGTHTDISNVDFNTCQLQVNDTVDVTLLRIDNCRFTGVSEFGVISNKTTGIGVPPIGTIDNVTITNSYFSDKSKGGVRIRHKVVTNGLIDNCVFEDIGSLGTGYWANAIELGSNELDDDDTTLGLFSVTNNQIKNTITDSTTEAHAVINYRPNVTISSNKVDTVKNGSTTGCEAIYTKGWYNVISNNTIIDGHQSIEGAIALKGCEFAVVSGNNILTRDNTVFVGEGIGCMGSNNLITGNTIEGVSESGISIGTAGFPAFTTLDNISIIGNTIRNCDRGITADFLGENILIDSNIMINSPDDSTLFLYISSAFGDAGTTEVSKNITVTNNIVTPYSVANTSSSCLYIRPREFGAFKNLVISGNAFDEAYRGVQFAGTPTDDTHDLIITNNQFGDTIVDSLYESGVQWGNIEENNTGRLQIRDNTGRQAFSEIKQFRTSSKVDLVLKTYAADDAVTLKVKGYVTSGSFPNDFDVFEVFFMVRNGAFKTKFVLANGTVDSGATVLATLITTQADGAGYDVTFNATSIVKPTVVIRIEVEEIL